MPADRKMWNKRSLGTPLICAVAVILVAVSAGSCARDIPAPDRSIKRYYDKLPEISRNANSRAPLVAIVNLSPKLPSVIEISATADGAEEFRREFAVATAGAVALPIIGLRPDSDYVVKVALRGPQSREVLAERELNYRTPPLPGGETNFPPFQVLRAEPARMEPGYTLIGVRRRALGRPQYQTERQRKFATDWGMIIALDAQGRVVWYYDAGTRVAGIDQLKNGNLLFHETQFRTREIDLLGNVVNEWYAERRPQGPSETPGAIPIKGIQTLHHQPHELPNGNFLAFAANARKVEDYYTSDTDRSAPRQAQMVMGDDVVEFDRKGDVVWRWSSWDHLDPMRIGYDTIWAYWWVRGFDQHMDWTHGNGVSYDVQDDSVIISLRHQDAILKIERPSGEIKWILGEPTDWPDKLRSKLLQPVGDLTWPYHQHNPRMTEAGTLIVFDNHAYGARPFIEPTAPFDSFSRGVEFRINEQDMTVEQVWSSATERNDDSCFTAAMGDAHRLPITGNRLVIHAFCVPYRKDVTYDNFDLSKRHTDDFAYGGRIREYASDSSPGDIVFNVEAKDPNDLMQWEIYGGLRTPSLYGSSNDQSPS